MSALVKKCTISDLEAESNLAELIAEYAAECSIEGMPEPRFKWDLYKSIEGAGMMHAYAAHVEGVLVGFAFVITTVNPHYSIVLATTETLFVTKDARRSHARPHSRRARSDARDPRNRPHRVPASAPRDWPRR